MNGRNPKPSWFHNRIFEIVGAAVRTPGLGSVTAFRQLSHSDQALTLAYYRAESLMESYMTYVVDKKRPAGG